MKKTLTAVASAVLATFILSSANADVLGTSVAKISNFLIKDDAGNVIDESQLVDLSFDSTAGATATLGGVSEAIDGATDSNSDGIDFPTKNSGATETPPGNDLCVGDCTGIIGPAANDNSFTVLDSATVQAAGQGSYSWADQLESGAPITGLTDSSGNPVSTGATVGNASYVYLDDSSSNDGSADSNNNLNASWDFVTNTDFAFLNFSFILDWGLVAFVDELETDAFATVNVSINFDLVDEFGNLLLNETTVNLALSRDELNNDPIQEISAGVSNSAQSFNTLGPIVANRTYTLTARINTNVDADRVGVPEPEILALLGLGFLGLGAVRRRMK